MALKMRGADVRFLFNDLKKDISNVLNYHILKYNIDFKTIIFKEPKLQNIYLQNMSTGQYDRNIFYIKDNTFVRGYFQSDMYFKDIFEQLKESFKLRVSIPHKTQAKLDQIRSSQSCFIHVRRGDYLNITEYLRLGYTYYKAAISNMIEKANSPRFYIFSDDIKFIEEVFLEKTDLNKYGNFEVINLHGSLHDYLDLELMRACKHGIIANSTFSWWAAYLIENKEKIIFSPHVFHFLNDNADLVPPEFRLIDYSYGLEIKKHNLSFSYKNAPPPPAQHAGEFLPNSDTKLAQQNSFNISKNKMLKLNKFHRNYRYRHVIYYKFYLKLIYRKISFKFTQFRHFISKR